jgi:hypothetical protein
MITILFKPGKPHNIHGIIIVIFLILIDVFEQGIYVVLNFTITLSCPWHLCCCRYEINILDKLSASNCNDTYPELIGTG